MTQATRPVTEALFGPIGKTVAEVEKIVATVTDIRPRLATRRREMSASGSVFGMTYGGGYYHAGEKFTGGLPNSGMSPIIDHQVSRYNAREAYHIAPVARAMVERFAETVVDAGLKLEPTPSASVLGITQEQAAEWSRDVAERFHLWAASKFAHTAEQMTFYQIQRQAEIFQQRDGEYFARFDYDDATDRPSPLSVSFVEPDQIGGCAYTVTQGYPYDTDGITRDSRGREVSYSVAVKRGNEWKVEKIPASLPNGRRVMVHGFCPEYASQTRGYSGLTHAIQEFEQLSQFTSAQIQKAIAQSAFIGGIETDKDSTPVGNILGDAASNFAAEDTGETAPENNEFGFDPMKVKISPGGIFIAEGLGAGQELKQYPNTAPVDSFEQFTSAFVSHLAASKSIPVEVLLMKFNANYSASRAALVMFWRVAQLWRAELKADFLDVVYEAWLSEEIGAGRISARGWLDPIMRLAWLACEWTGSPMPNIDPEKSVKASRLAIESNLSNYQREARELNGSDAATNKSLNAEFSRGMKKAPWKGGNDPAPTGAQPGPMPGSGSTGDGNTERNTGDEEPDEPEDVDE